MPSLKRPPYPARVEIFLLDFNSSGYLQAIRPKTRPEALDLRFSPWISRPATPPRRQALYFAFSDSFADEAAKSCR